MTTPGRGPSFPRVGALLALLLSACGPRPEARGWSVLLVTLDTVRADHVGAYGNSDAETPTLDRLAQDGLRFADVSAAAPLTLPSHATILSGLLPPHHGLRGNGSGRFPGDVPTLATRLRAAGYRTGAFVGAFVLDSRFGLNAGFDHYDDAIDRLLLEREGLGAERRGDAVVDRTLAWLGTPEASRAASLFVWVHLYDAHAPYDPPEPYRGRHESPYDGEIAFVDAQVGRLVAALATDRRRWVVAVTADHGEALGQHGELTHGLLVYEPSLRVPWIVTAPGVVPAGSVLSTPVSLADVGPTLAGLLGLPAGADSERLDGRDLSASLRDADEPEARDVYAESEYPRTFGWAGIASLRRASWKYVAAPRPELYDLSADPGETRNVVATSAVARDLAGRLAGLAATARPGAGPAPLDDEVRARLRSLGYAATSSTATGPGDARDPKDAVELFRQFEEANWALQEGRAANAVAVLTGLVDRDPANPVFRGLLARGLRRIGRLDQAIATYRDAVAAAPDDPEVRYDLAVTLQEAGRQREALEAIEEALRRDERRPEAHNVLGIALFAQGRPEAALEQFQRAGSLDPHDARVQNNRGNVLRALGRADEAAAAYRKAVELSPSYADPLNGLGTLEVGAGRPLEAVSWFDRALAVAPEYHEARLNRAIALDEAGDAEGAAAGYREFLHATRGDPRYSEQASAAARLLARVTGR